MHVTGNHREVASILHRNLGKKPGYLSTVNRYVVKVQKNEPVREKDKKAYCHLLDSYNGWLKIDEVQSFLEKNDCASFANFRFYGHSVIQLYVYHVGSLFEAMEIALEKEISLQQQLV